jgi:hypothetical protein
VREGAVLGAEPPEHRMTPGGLGGDCNFGEAETATAVQEQPESRLLPCKHPREVQFASELPKAANEGRLPSLSQGVIIAPATSFLIALNDVDRPR